MIITNWQKIFLSVLVFPGILYLSSCSNQKESGPSVVKIKSLSPGAWKFSGHLGDYIDTIARGRITDKSNWDMIYPETEEAFVLKEDDENYPESGAWRGEFWGKYILSAIAAAKYYHSNELKNRIARAVKGLLGHMDKSGYLGTYTRPDFVIGNNWNIWTRKYTLWGLLESWELLKEPEILQAARKFTDQLMTIVGPGKIDIIRTGNFYGLPSTSILYPIVKLYEATGDSKYLTYAEYIVHQWSQHPKGLPDILNKGLSDQPVHTWFPDHDPYKWAKGYELTSCVEGLLELYKVTGKQNYFSAAKNIHEVLVLYECSPVGSVSFNDKFTGSSGLINTISEICDAVYWNRLSFQLFKLTGEEKYVREFEKTLYNALLCAFNRQGTWGLRRLRTSQIHIPATNQMLQHHQCCTDNLPRGLFQASEVVLMKKNDREVYLSLFNEGTGSIQLGGDIIRFKMEGDFLDNSPVRVTVFSDKPRDFMLNIRLPAWSNKTQIKVNNRTFSQNSSYQHWNRIQRLWTNGDVIEITFNINLQRENFHPETFDAAFHPIGFYNSVWAKMRYVKGSNEELNKKYGHVVSLDINDALPQEQAFTFFYGPIALARDIRISGHNVFERLPDPGNPHALSVRPVPSPVDIWKTYEINMDGDTLRFCDFSSAGNTWDKQSLFNTWCLIKK